MATTAAPRLSDEALVDLLGLIGKADSVELKVTVAPENQRSALLALGLDPLNAQVRMVYFFDTPQLDLQNNGVVVRARRVQGKGDDTVVKLRPIDPAELPPAIRRSPAFGVEVDVIPGGYVCSGSMKAKPKLSVRDVAAGMAPLRKLFGKEQRALFDDYSPSTVAFDDLVVLGPIFVLKLAGVPEGFPRKLVTEAWLYPDGTRLIELSTKCAPAEAFQVAAESRAYLSSRGIEIGASGQQTKTKKAMSYFASELS